MQLHRLAMAQPAQIRWARSAIGAVVIIVMTLHWYVLATSFLAPGTFKRAGIPSRLRGVDVRALHRAGMLARRGEMVFSVYGFSRRIPGDVSAPPFRYPPAAAYTLGLALALFPRNSAHAVWLGVMELLLLANALLLARLVPDARRLCVLLAFWLLVPPVFVDLWLGQFSLITALLFFWAILAWGWHREETNTEPSLRRSLGTVLWGAAVLLKGMPLLYGLAIWKAPKLSRAVIQVTALLLLTTSAYFALFPADVMNFLWLNGDASQAWYLPSNEGLWNVLGRMTSSGDAARAQQRAVSLGLFAAVGFAVFLAVRTAGPVHHVWMIGTLTCAFLLTFKEVWSHHYCFLLPFASLLFLSWRPAPGSAEPTPVAGTTLQHWAAWALLIWLILPNVVWGSGVRIFGLQAALFWRPVPTLLLFLLCVWVCRGKSWISLKSAGGV